eukprot:1394838-Amorphochlora_amoeboformis.AAC.1
MSERLEYPFVSISECGVRIHPLDASIPFDVRVAARVTVREGIATGMLEVTSSIVLLVYVFT